MSQDKTLNTVCYTVGYVYLAHGLIMSNVAGLTLQQLFVILHLVLDLDWALLTAKHN